MGMYTGLRFIGTVKPEFRETFEPIAIHGNWESSTDSVFAEFGKYDRAGFIPCGMLCYMPDSWDNDARFERSYDADTGRWTFCCSLKNYKNEIEAFLDMVPYFCESVEHCEYYYEEWSTSRMYKLVEKTMYVVKEETWLY